MFRVFASQDDAGPALDGTGNEYLGGVDRILFGDGFDGGVREEVVDSKRSVGHDDNFVLAAEGEEFGLREVRVGFVL